MCVQRLQCYNIICLYRKSNANVCEESQKDRFQPLREKGSPDLLSIG